ncbi:MAG: ATP-dependent sacrificial sulfur transferase LarE [Phycisphaerae bacterium]|jgi:uncharacterized protein
MTDSQSTTEIRPLDDRLAACKAILTDLGRVVVAFSAGVDSTFLLALAVETLGTSNVLAATGVSPSLPQRELDEARKLAAKIGVEMVEIVTDEQDDPNYAANPARRCFFCKSALFTRLTDLQRERGFSAVVSGANAADPGDFRPGLEAGRKLGVRNPLMEAGLTKADIRAASRTRGLPTWDKPAMACLASRIPYGEAITPQRLGRIEQAEDYLKDLGFGQCRVRDHDTVARIEVPPDNLVRLLHERAGIIERFKSLGFTYISLDLQGLRTGSMNEVLTSPSRDASNSQARLELPCLDPPAA